MKENRKDAFVGVYSPGRRLFEFSVKKKNDVGSLSKITALLADLGVNLFSGFLTAYPDEPISLFGFVADLTGLKLETSEVVKRLKALDVVLDVRFKGARPRGIVVDELHFPLFALDRRSILLRVDTVRGMFSKLYEEFGPGASTIIYYMGLEAGRRKAELVKKAYGLKGKDAVRLVLRERIAKGWCLPKLMEFDEEAHEAKVRVYESFECRPSKGKEPMSRFFKGYLAGLFSFMFKVEVIADEVKCLAKGDGYCEFVIEPRDRLKT